MVVGHRQMHFGGASGIISSSLCLAPPVRATMSVARRSAFDDDRRPSLCPGVRRRHRHPDCKELKLNASEHSAPTGEELPATDGPDRTSRPAEERNAAGGGARKRGPAKGQAEDRLVRRGQVDLLAAASRAGLPQLRGQAVLHPVPIDDARPCKGRPAGGHQIPLWLVVGLAKLPPVAADEQPAVRTHGQTRRCRDRHASPARAGHIKRVVRPSRRHDRDGRRHADDQRLSGGA